MPEEGEKLTIKKYKPFNATPSHRKSFLRYKSQQCLTLDSAIGPTLLNIVGDTGLPVSLKPLTEHSKHNEIS